MTEPCTARICARLWLAMLLAGIAAQPLAQEQPQGSRRSGIREFLGLGAPPDAAAAERGAPLYAEACAFCHGPKARGGTVGPNLIRSVLVLHDEGGTSIGPFLLKGNPDKGMPAFPQLTESQTYDVAQFLHMQVELAANRGTYKRSLTVAGDAKRGEAFFNGEGGCVGCHSLTGDLARVRQTLTPDQIQARFLWPAGGGFGTGTARHVTVTLPDGTRIPGTVKRLDDFDVSLYDKDGNFHSYPRNGVRVEFDDRLKAHRELLGRYTDEIVHDLTAYLVAK